MKDSVVTIKVNGEKIQQIRDIENHSVAVQIVLEKLIDLGIIRSYDEIEGVGHRVVHGADVLTESVLITEKEIGILESIVDLAPLHLIPNLTGIKAFKEILPAVKQVAVFDTAFHHTMAPEAYFMLSPTTGTNGMRSANTDSTAPATNTSPNGRQSFLTRPSTMSTSSSVIWATAPRSALSRAGSPSTRRWDSRRLKGFRWAPAPATSIPPSSNT